MLSGKEFLRAFAGLSLVLAASCAAPERVATAAAPAVENGPAQTARADLPADPAVRSGTLDNGLRYAVMANGTPAGEASIRLRIHAGSLMEEEDQLGLAHFLEHMVLNGTANVPEGEFVRRLERAGLKFGPDTNASTGFDATTFMLDLPEVDEETVDTALYLLREVAEEATLAPSAIEAERGIILSEERARATPNLRLAMDEMAFLLKDQRVPTRWPIGSTEIIATAPRERFVEFYDAYYRPENATLVAVGDFDPQEMEAKIRSFFASWEGRGEPGPEPDLGSVAERSLESRLFVEPGVANRVSISWLAPPDDRPDSRAKRIGDWHANLALKVLARRLERIAATEENPPFIAATAGWQSLADSADVVQLFAVAEPRMLEEALAAIEREQRRIVEHGVSEAELAVEIADMRAGLERAVEGAATRNSPSLAGTIVGLDEDEVFTTPATQLEIFEEAAFRLTPERARAVLAELFSGEGPLLYFSSPVPVEGGEAALLAAYRASRANPVEAPEMRAALAWPYEDFGAPGEIVESREMEALGATAVRFANGVRLTVKQTDFRGGEILVAARLAGGRLAMPGDRPSPEWAMGLAFVSGGLEQLSFEDMQEVLTGVNYALSLDIDEDAFVLEGDTRPEDFATQLQILAAYVAEPGWRPTGWDRLRALGSTIHDNLASTPGGVFSRDSGTLLRSGDRRWATPSAAEMAASSIADAQAVLGPALADAPLEVIIVGDVNVETAIAGVAATFGALPPRGETQAKPFAIRFPAGNSEPARLTHEGRADQGLAFIAWPTDDFYEDIGRSRALHVLAELFQLRLNEKIREEQGTTYSPNAFHSTSDVFDGYGYLGGRIEAPPEALGPFLDDAMAIAADLRDAPVEADELRRARQPLIERIQRARNASNSFWLRVLASAQEDRRVEPRITEQFAQYEGVTPAMLQQVAQRYLRPDAAYKIVIVPGGQ